MNWRAQLHSSKKINPEEKTLGIFLPTSERVARRIKQTMFPFLVWAFLLSTSCYAYTDLDLANAIFKAENSKSHPYGILTHYKHTSPRTACLNTIHHAKRDFNGKGDFIVFLGNRYCPVGAKNDPRGLNKNWVRNVKGFLNEKVN